MRMHRRIGAVSGVAVAAAVFALAAAPPVLAAGVPGWRVVASYHFPPAGNFSALTNVIAPGRHDAWAFGGTNLNGSSVSVGRPIAKHWAGGHWRASRLPAGLTGYISAVSAPAANDIWAITFFSGYLLHWNGTRWSLSKQLAGGGELTGVTALSRKNVWVFGGGGFIGGLGTWHYDGHSWTE